MKDLDHSRPSLVEFLSSIKFSREPSVPGVSSEQREHFARLRPLTRRKRRSEESHLIRSAN